MSGTGGGITVLSTGGACIAPSGVQKERMQPHEIFLLPVGSDDSVAQTVPGAYICPPPQQLLIPYILRNVRLSDAPKGLKISQCTPLFQVVYRLRSGSHLFASRPSLPPPTLSLPYRIVTNLQQEYSSARYSRCRDSLSCHLYRVGITISCARLRVSLHQT